MLSRERGQAFKYLGLAVHQKLENKTERKKGVGFEENQTRWVQIDNETNPDP